MSSRLYYTDADRLSFEATVLACDPNGDRFHVVLSQSAFYPTSGGQPFDTGTLGGRAVVDVIDREDGDVVHVTDGALDLGASVYGEIDAARRADHRQQHTGQHVLSAVFDGVSAAPTFSFHLGADVCTIDVARELGAEAIAGAETEANRLVWADRPVHVRFVSAEEAAALPLRKPTGRAGEVRLVDIRDVDLSACGGTHVGSTGAIGLIAITGWERCKGGTRVSFVCGRRALESHRRLRDIVVAAGRLLSAGAADIGPQVERMQQEARERARLLAALEADLARYRAQEWREAAETVGPCRVVLRTDVAGDAAALRMLAQAVVDGPGLVAVLLGTGQPLPIVVARSTDVLIDAGTIVRSVTSALGGRGGGRPELAQGGVTADADRVLPVVRHALAP